MLRGQILDLLQETRLRERYPARLHNDAGYFALVVFKYPVQRIDIVVLECNRRAAQFRRHAARLHSR